MSHFKLISSTKASDVIPVNKYISDKTGITVIIAGVGGPLVNGFFCLATEAHDDDGLPHTLEHLIFLGSSRYPYKGILDLLANRCMAHGTNAWTDTDHTCYTIDTAGDAGMLTLLPIYLDHILNPTLTEHGFVTEVHHIDGNGEDAGVVYCEMQGRENSAESRCELQLLRAMYPDSGYSSETGGIMKNLRTSTDNNKVRDFHRKFYRAENLTIILTGQIEAEDVFKALATVEDDIIAKREQESVEEWVKPWRTVPPPPQYGEYDVQWPADTEDCGQVVFGWRGPLLTERAALRELTSCALLLRYLCDTAAAPLQRRLVERQDALAGDVSYGLTENLSAMIKIQLDNVPVAKLATARDEALKCLRDVRSGAESIDLERMKTLIRKQLRESIASLESQPHHAVAFRCIGDCLYSNSEEDFISRMNPQMVLTSLLEESPEHWRGMLQKYFTDELVSIVGKPSIQLQDSMAEEEKKRIEEQRARLGESGLTDKARILDEAMEFNERPPPAGTLAAVPVPGCNFKCHAISTWSSDGEPCPHFDLKEIPIYTRVHSLSTNFVYINIIVDTTKVDEKTRKWLCVQLNGLAECAVRRGEALLPHEDVISTTEQLTVMFANNIGFSKSGNFSVGHFGNFVHIETRCEPKDYVEVVDHLYEVLYQAEITKERLLVFVQRLINDVAQVRRDGHKMVYDTLRDSVYDTDTNLHWSGVLRQQAFLKQLIDQLNEGGDSAENALKDARETYKNLFANAWLHIATDFTRYTLSTEPWKKFAPENQITPSKPYLYLDAELMRSTGGGFIVGCGGVESTFLASLSPAPRGYSVPLAAPLTLALHYFTQLEGPMWRLIRGSGLSYGYGVRPSLHEAKLVLSLYRATNPVAAYTKTKAIMTRLGINSPECDSIALYECVEHLSGDSRLKCLSPDLLISTDVGTFYECGPKSGLVIVEEYLSSGKFDSELFASARSTAIFEAVEAESCPADVVRQSLINYVRQAGQCYNSKLVCALASVTEEEAHKAAKEWLPKLFDQSQGKMAVVCHPTKVNDIQAAFNKIDVMLEAFESLEASHFNK